jgi:hypothetical protein
VAHYPRPRLAAADAARLRAARADKLTRLAPRGAGRPEAGEYNASRPRFAILLAACAPSSPLAQKQKPDPTNESWYGQTVNELAATNRRATELFHKRKQDEAAALIEKGETLSKRLLAIPQPTLAAVEAASDLDQLYGEMLFSNHNYGWASLMFQRNVARWKNQTPQTAETAARLKVAEDSVSRCERRIAQLP